MTSISRDPVRFQELRDACEEKGLDSTGIKAVLLERLEQALAGGEDAPAAAEERARTGSPSPPRLGAEVLKLRTGAVRARCVSARRAALTTALDMLPRAAKSARERHDTLLASSCV